EEAQRITGGNKGMNLMMAISYGGRDEIVRAVKRFIEKGGDMDEVNEESFEENLDTGGVAPVDLIIRTGGEKRISNFLVWQAAYAELFFTDTLWPDFTKEEFMYAIEDYKLRQRRFGMIPDKAET
ncbi:MAG: di-trans,poly-cis-decaprenylcistransferase, partial [Nitrospirae bacterium]|nr:di-trans,poly-cis-decaprenylcistransferase [Nitrospirota bacterium]